MILFHALGPKGSLVELLIGIEHVGICADTVHKETITIAIIAIETISFPAPEWTLGLSLFFGPYLG